MQIEFGTVIVAGFVQAAIGVLFWLSIQRTVEKLDRLQGEVQTLKDKNVKAIAGDLKEHTEANEKRFAEESAGRKEIHDVVNRIERDYVQAQLCRETHQALADSLLEYRSSVVDMARVQTRLDGTVKFLDEVNQRVLGTVADVAAINRELDLKRG